MPEFTVTDLGLPRDVDPDECIILEGVAHVFGRDDLADQIMAQATIPDQVWILRNWNTTPIGRAEAFHGDEDIRVRAWIPVDQVSALVRRPCLALAVKIVGRDGEASTMDYVSVVPARPAAQYYRLTQVPGDQGAIRALSDYVHVGYGDTLEWRHRDDPVLLGSWTPPDR